MVDAAGLCGVQLAPGAREHPYARAGGRGAAHVAPRLMEANEFGDARVAPGI